MSLEEELKKFSEESDKIDDEAKELAIELSQWLSKRKIQNALVTLALFKIYAAICQTVGVPRKLSVALASLGIEANWREDLDAKPH